MRKPGAPSAEDDEPLPSCCCSCEMLLMIDIPICMKACCGPGCEAAPTENNSDPAAVSLSEPLRTSRQREMAFNCANDNSETGQEQGASEAYKASHSAEYERLNCYGEAGNSCTQTRGLGANFTFSLNMVLTV